MQSSDAEVCGLCLELSDPQTQLGFLPWNLGSVFFGDDSCGCCLSFGRGRGCVT